MHSEAKITFSAWMKKKHNMEVSDVNWFKLAMDYFQEYKQETYDENEKGKGKEKRRQTWR